MTKPSKYAWKNMSQDERNQWISEQEATDIVAENFPGGEVIISIDDDGFEVIAYGDDGCQLDCRYADDMEQAKAIAEDMAEEQAELCAWVDES